jgi:hypothetical protein
MANRTNEQVFFSVGDTNKYHNGFENEISGEFYCLPVYLVQGYEIFG